MAAYQPKPGSGWEEGPSPIMTVRRWRRLILPGIYLQVSVSAGDHFIISRVVFGEALHHAPPGFADMKRVEADFEVKAWSIFGTVNAIAPSEGQCLAAIAVDPRSH